MAIRTAVGLTHSHGTFYRFLRKIDAKHLRVMFLLYLDNPAPPATHLSMWRGAYHGSGIAV